MASIADQAHSLLVQVRVGVVDPQSPGLDVFTNTEVTEDLSVELWVVVQEF